MRLIPALMTGFFLCGAAGAALAQEDAPAEKAGPPLPASAAVEIRETPYDPCPDVPAPPPDLPDRAALEKQAQGGAASAAFTLAGEYAKDKNFPEAERLYRFALYKGDGRAALALYDLYKDGSIKLDDAENVRNYGLGLMEEAASKGGGSAAMDLAFIYLYGQGRPHDYDAAASWFERAAAAGKPMADYQLGLLYSSGLHQDISPRRAFHYFEQAAAGGIGLATRQVAIAYHTGIGAAKNLDQAIVCYKRSAAQGEMLAMRDLGNIYRIERPDSAASASWYAKAAALGDPDSHYMLGVILRNSSPGEARNHFLAAAKKKHHLARIEVDPDYVPKDHLEEAPPDEGAHE